METSAPHLDHCRSCRAPIVWAAHILTGKAAPLDATPVPDGNCVYYPSDGTYRVIKKGDPILPPAEEQRRFTNHFQTCPQAKKWGRK